MVLRGIGQTIQQEVNGQQKDTPARGAGLLRCGRGDFLASSWMVQTEGRNAQRNHEDHAILVQGVFLPEDGQV